MAPLFRVQIRSCRSPCAFGMSAAIILAMVRRTVTLPDDLDRRIRELADGGSFSAEVTRILEAGIGKPMPSYVGTGKGGGENDSVRVEEILEEMFRDPEFKH